MAYMPVEMEMHPLPRPGLRQIVKFAIFAAAFLAAFSIFNSPRLGPSPVIVCGEQVRPWSWADVGWPRSRYLG